ncbi:glycosyltransferase family 2 protein [Labrys okinawensis]|uniref:glycosyltransferase family 2 protein n=1 Tax=Labrys okinawensis TaxID=346911 RepID=UPI0039BD1C6D
MSIIAKPLIAPSKPNPTPVPSSPLPLSVFIIAFNEADRIGPTIEAVRELTDDLVVIDSGSTDGTQEIASRLGGRVIHNSWPGYGPQKRFAEDQCRHNWILNVDADEVVSPRLAASIRALFEGSGPAADGYETTIAEIFPGEREPHPWGHTLSPVRLYRLDRGRYVDSTVHDRVHFNVSPRIERLKGKIHHFSVRSLGDEIAKLNSYTEQQAEDLDLRGKTLNTWRILTEFPLNFLKAYIGRRHFVRGLYGIATATNYAYFRFLRLAKHMERRRMRDLE